MKNTNKQKAILRIAGFIAIIAMIVFSFTSCGSLNDLLFGRSDGPTYKIGDRGPGGGIVFYDHGNNAHGWRYFEVSPENLGEAFWAIQNSPGIRTISGARGVAIGTGKENTAAILAADPTAPAAKLCVEYRGGGLDDWFLPSRDELNEIYKQRRVLNITAGTFWSSSQGPTPANAWLHVFSNDNRNPGYKDYMANNIRAVRSF